MAIPTVLVSLDIAQITGLMLPFARAQITLTRADIVDATGEVVAAESHLIQCDADGHGDGALFPNALGRLGTNYAVAIFDQYGHKVFPAVVCGGKDTALCYIPAHDCALSDILFTVPPLSQDDAWRAVVEAREAAGTARASSAAPLFVFEPDIEDAAPAPGGLRLNAEDPALATEILASVTEKEGFPVAGLLLLLASSTSPTAKSIIVLRDSITGASATYRLTGDAEVDVDYVRLTGLEYVEGSGEFVADGTVAMQYSIVGDYAPTGGPGEIVFGTPTGGAAESSPLLRFDKVAGVLRSAAPFVLAAAATIGWGATADAAPDTVLVREAPGMLALKAGATLQGLRVYGVDDGPNYERGFFAWNGSVLQIGTDQGGTGAGRAIRFLTAGANRWQIAGTGHISAITSNAYDIVGARTVRAETSLEVSTNGLRLSWTAGTGGTVQTTGQPLLLNPSGNAVQLGGGSFAELRFTDNALGPRLFYSGVGNALEQRNGTTPQVFRVYETYTDPSNFSRGYFQAAVGLFQLRTDAAGTGIARNIGIRPGGNAVFFGFGTGGGTQFTFTGGDASNAQLTMRPTGALLYSIIEMQGQDGVGTAGMLLQAGQNAGWIGADTITLRKRDNTLNYLVLNTTAATFGVGITGTGNALEVRNGTSLQTLRIYGSYTDASNYERLGIYRHAIWGWTLENQAAGTGGNRPVALSGFRVYFVVGGAAVWRVESTGNFRPEADNAIDIGAPTAAPRSIYAGTSVVAPGLTTTPLTVATLPTSHPTRDGMRAYVTDSTLPYTAANIGTVVTGGGANKVPVMHVYGTGWVIG